LVNELLHQFPFIVLKEENLMTVLDKFPPPSDKWSISCTKHVDGMGYTCGLWELFHIVSVGLVEYNLLISTNDDVVLSELSLSTIDAAETIRNFIEYFFSCDVCRYNFLKAYDNCAHDRCHRLSDKQMDTAQWIQFPIWLFETHNAVNVRLYEEQMRKTSQNGIISHHDKLLVQWPNQKICTACWLHGSNNDGWDDESVYKYLRTEYWSEDLISADYRAEVTGKEPFVEETEEEEAILTRSTILKVIEWFVVIFLTGTWYYKRSKHIQSGLHKKKDVEC
jgi:Erv1 / Alr family